MTPTRLPVTCAYHCASILLMFGIPNDAPQSPELSPSTKRMRMLARGNKAKAVTLMCLSLLFT